MALHKCIIIIIIIIIISYDKCETGFS